MVYNCRFRSLQKDSRLPGNHITSFPVTSPADCTFKCLQIRHCSAFNYQVQSPGGDSVCDIIQTQVRFDKWLIPDAGFTYYYKGII